VWMPGVPTKGDPFLCEVAVDTSAADPPFCTWVFLDAGQRYTPNIQAQAPIAIDTAQVVAHRDLLTCPRANRPFQNRILAELQHCGGLWWLVVLVVAGLVGWYDGALDGRTPWIGGDTAYLSFLRRLGYEWHGAFWVVCLGLVLPGVLLPLLPHLERLKEPPPPPAATINWPASPPYPLFPHRPGIGKSPSGVIDGPSLGGACYLTIVLFSLEQWCKHHGKRLPAWGRELQQRSSTCVVSAEVDSNGNLQSVAEWPAKLQAIYDALCAGRPIHWVICAAADKHEVGEEWGTRTAGQPLNWEPYAGTGCDRAFWQEQNQSVTFLACPTTRALLATLDPPAFDLHQHRQHRQRAWWGAVIETVVLAVLGALPSLQPYCPQPGLTVSFPPEKFYHFLGDDPRPWVKLAPEEESIDMAVQAWGCDPPGHVQWSAKASAGVFKVPGDRRRPPVAELTADSIACPLLPTMQKPQWRTLLLPKGTAIEVTVVVQPHASCPSTSMATSQTVQGVARDGLRQGQPPPTTFMLLREAH